MVNPGWPNENVTIGGAEVRNRQDAMTSKQVMLAAALVSLVGCAWNDSKPTADPLVSPYGDRRVWAVAPLLNESGSLGVDGARFADHLGRQLETASNIDTLPTNRVLAAMEQLELERVSSVRDALAIIELLDADALVVGTVTDYEVYDPPKIGLALELFVHPRRMHYRQRLNVDGMMGAAVDPLLEPTPKRQGNRPQGSQPASTMSGFFDAADPFIRERLQRYAQGRGGDENPNAWRKYRISTDLFTEFVSYVAAWRLLKQERTRLYLEPQMSQTNPSP